MPDIVLKNISKRFGHFEAVKNLNLEIHDRDYIILLGPSGCGKTTTLRLIAGLETPTEGEISIDQKIVFSSEKGINIPPDKRDVGFLFQNYALWPHMTVYQNIAFGLENLKWKKDKIKSRVSEITRLLRIEELLARYPSELSGGQQQRVAIARTLAPRPKVLLMDEPLSNLDAKLRTEMRSELKRLHREIESTFVYVTHDQLEAMTLATQICLINRGILQQLASPLKIYDRPLNLFIGNFIGNPTMNFIDVTCSDIKGNQCILKHKDIKISFIGENTEEYPKIGQKLILGIRPEDIKIKNDGKVKGVVYSILPSGMETIVRVKIGEIFLTLVVFGRVNLSLDQECSLEFASHKYILFDKETKANITLGKILSVNQ